jgi:hypothetical protein
VKQFLPQIRFSLMNALKFHISKHFLPFRKPDLDFQLSPYQTLAPPSTH